MVDRPTSGFAPLLQRRMRRAAKAGTAGAESRRWRSTRSDAAWEQIPLLRADARQLARRLVVSHAKGDPGAVAFDILRTRLLKVCADNRWRRVAITSATKGMGKSMICANLAFALSRTGDTRAVMLDLDLRMPGLGKIFGLREPRAMADFLRGETPAEQFLQRIGPNMAVGLNMRPTRDSGELLQSTAAKETLATIESNYAPDLMLFDLPPVLVSDDALALLPQVDAALIVAAAGESTARELKDCESLISGSCNLIGIVLNKCRYDAADGYKYYYGEA